MDGASLCICTVSSINNPRCAWHGGVPESPFVIMDGWRLHKPLCPAESALCQAPLASLGPSFADGTPAGGPCPRVPAPSHGHRRQGGLCCLQAPSWLGAVGTAGKLFIDFGSGSLAFYRRLCEGFFPPRLAHLLKEKSTGQMPSVEAEFAERSGHARQGS